MGGRATSGGVVFQAEVGALAAGLLLAERPLSRLASGLPGLPKKVRFETPADVDDVLIETSKGEVFIQAKRNINLSSRTDGELASVADQFVRQFRRGVSEAGIHREFDPERDRMVLAVGEATPGTVSRNLQEALERNRTGAATGIPAHLATALETFAKLIDVAWLQHAEVEITQKERQALLAMCSVVVLGDSQRQLVEEALRDIVASVGSESTLFDLLVSWAADASADGVGGDASAIRLALSGKARLCEPPSYREDVNRLHDYSASVLGRLKRFTEIPSPEGPVSITRTVSSLVASAARDGSLAITGEPGAGKSAVLYDAASHLAEAATVIVLTVEATAQSTDTLRAEIGLQHPLIDVLAQIPGDRPAYLILDALDAVRGGVAEATYKRLVQNVSGLPGWHILASIRTFDLRLGKEWRRLFAGTPPVSTHADESFPAVRHLHIGLLSNEEKEDLAAKSTSLATAINAAGPRMNTLARNPFNLALLGDLLRAGVAASTLSQVATRGELLEQYWQERIAELGLPATTALKGLVERMLVAHSIDLPETEVPDTGAQAIDNLQGAGVLVTEPTRRIGFRHHILFDYAIARLILLPDTAKASNYLSKSGGAGLLVIPSLGYWLEGLRTSLTPKEFWTFTVNLMGSDDTDPIVRVETARLCTESVQDNANLTPLADVLNRGDPAMDNAFQHIAGSLIIQSQLKQPIQTNVWANLLRLVEVSSPKRLVSSRGIVGVLLDSDPDADARNSLGIVSRRLFDAMSANEQRIHWLAPVVIPYVARTYGTDPSESRKRLAQLFEPDRFSRTGYVEVPWLAQESLHIADNDEELVVQLFYRSFCGGDFSGDQETHLSASWILSLTSNAAQDFQMAAYSLRKDYPALLHQCPTTALRAFGAALRAERESRHPAGAHVVVKEIVFDGMNREFEEDHSYAWAWDIDDEDCHDDYAALYRSTMDWAKEVDDEILLQVPSHVLGEARIALAWRAVLEIATIKPGALGKAFWQVAVAPVLLHSLDTRQTAINAVAATYPFLSDPERVKAEAEWLQMEFSEFPDPDHARIEILGTLFEKIGKVQLATEAARSFLQDARKDGQRFENSKPFEVRITSGRDRHWLEREGVDVGSQDTAPLLKLSNEVHKARDAVKENATDKNGKALWDATSALEKAIAQAGKIDSGLDREVSDALAEGLGLSLFHEFTPEDSQSFAVSKLLDLTYHSFPPPLDEDAEEQFSSFPSWGSPSPRIEAAQAIAMIVAKSKFWPLVRARYESLLLEDPHPAVRLQLIHAIPWLELIDTGAMWKLLKRIFAQEKNQAILRDVARKCFALRRQHAMRLETLILPLAAIKLPETGDDPITALIVYFAIDRNLPNSKELLSLWIKNFWTEERHLRLSISYVRKYLLVGIDEADADQDSIRARARNFLWSLIDMIEPTVRSLPQSGNGPTTEGLSAFKLLESVTDQIYFAVGHDQISPKLSTNIAKRRFLSEYTPFVSKLNTLGSPHSVHHLLSVLEKMTEANPERSFDLFSEAILRTTGVARYEHESLGAELFVKLIGMYLADYRSIFEDEVRRRKLIDCIALFVESGWPEARKLFQNIPELLQ